MASHYYSVTKAFSKITIKYFHHNQATQHTTTKLVGNF